MSDAETQPARTTCLRCLRPTTHCYCALIPKLTPKTRVVIVRHLRERFVPIGTARMAHLALHGSVLVDAVDDVDARIAFDDDTAVLFPSDDATPLEQLAKKPRTLVVLDGTWSQARSLLRKNEKLAALPRISYRPAQPGNYRIRKEPRDECLATIEAVAAVLGALEGDVDAYAQLLRPFTWMVDKQIEAAETSGRHRSRTKEKSVAVDDELRALLSRSVLAYAEANAHPRHDRAPGSPELLHLVAHRLRDDARFEARLKPVRPLPDEVARRLGTRDFVDERADAVARFRAFVDGAPLLLWGPYVRDLLVAEGEPRRGFTDLRQVTARFLGASPGGIQRAAAQLDVDVAGDTLDGPRAHRMLSLLRAITSKLVAR